MHKQAYVCVYMRLQATVFLPGGLIKAEAPHPRALVLELWAAGHLVCSNSALLFPSHLSSAFTELQELFTSQTSSGQELSAKGRATHSQLSTEDAAFVSDLVCWMHYTASACSVVQQQQQQQQQQQGLPEDMHKSPTDAEDEELALMADVGRGLLDYSLCSGMLDVAGEAELGLGNLYPTHARCGR